MLKQLLPLPQGLIINSVEITPTALNFAVATTAPTATYPLCTQLSAKVQSRYYRTLADLTWANQSVQLRLHLRRFFCLNGKCQRRIFCERLEPLTQAYAHKTKRLLAALTDLALALGGRPAEALAKKQGLPTSRSSLLRLLHQYQLPTFPSPKLLGVDDFALKKGRVYATLLVDLETHQPIEVLGDRTDKTFGEWLQQHPTIEIISRDRDSSYAKAAHEFAPQAGQIADRFHLLKNLRDYVDDFCQRKRVWQLVSKQKEVAAKVVNPTSSDLTQTTALARQLPPLAISSQSKSLVMVDSNAASIKKLTKEQQRQQEPYHKRLERYQQVRELVEVVASNRQIAAQLKLDHSTVSRYVKAANAEEAVGSKPRTPKASLLDEYKAYLYERWREEQPTVSQLYQELCQQGYKGSIGTIRLFLARLRPKKGWSVARTKIPQHLSAEEVAISVAKAQPKLSSRQASWLLFKLDCEKEMLTKEQRNQLVELRQADNEIEVMYQLVQAFRQMLRAKEGAKLAEWLEKAAASQIQELESFVSGVELDYQAVKAGLSLDYSNGQLEGQVNRVKNIKRAMYGRASFELLRTRILAA